MKRDNWIMWIKIYLNIVLKKFYKPNMTELQMLGNSFCEFGLVSTYQRFSATFWPQSAIFWKYFTKDSGPAVSSSTFLGSKTYLACFAFHLSSRVWDTEFRIAVFCSYFLGKVLQHIGKSFIIYFNTVCTFKITIKKGLSYKVRF